MPRRGHVSSRPQPSAREREANWKAPGAREHAQVLVSHLLEELRLTDTRALTGARTLTHEAFQARALGGLLRAGLSVQADKPKRCGVALQCQK